jgi:hypothetical protein
MKNEEMPSYAIVEILIRISAFHPNLGRYKDHDLIGPMVVIKITSGRVMVKAELVSKHLQSPHTVSLNELENAVIMFLTD